MPQFFGKIGHHDFFEKIARQPKKSPWSFKNTGFASKNWTSFVQKILKLVVVNENVKFL